MEFFKNKKLLIRTFDLGIRIFTGFMVTIYGLAKPIQFAGTEEYADKLLSELAGMELMWAFFGYSLTVPIVVGVLQVLGSILLIFKKTKLLGIFILLPILSNIVLFDIVYDVNKGATMYAIIFLIFILISAFIEKEKLIHIFKTITQTENTLSKKETYLKMGLGLLLGILFFFFFQMMLNR